MLIPTILNTTNNRMRRITGMCPCDQVNATGKRAKLHHVGVATVAGSELGAVPAGLAQNRGGDCLALDGLARAARRQRAVPVRRRVPARSLWSWTLGLGANVKRSPNTQRRLPP